MARLSDKVKASIEANRKAFAGMSLEQRTKHRGQLQELVELPPFLRAVTPGVNSDTILEARELIKVIDDLNNVELTKRHGRRATQTPK